jgi:hypothetical protein
MELAVTRRSPKEICGRTEKQMNAFEQIHLYAIGAESPWKFKRSGFSISKPSSPSIFLRAPATV